MYCSIKNLHFLRIIKPFLVLPLDFKFIFRIRSILYSLIPHLIKCSWILALLDHCSIFFLYFISMHSKVATTQIQDHVLYYLDFLMSYYQCPQLDGHLNFAAFFSYLSINFCLYFKNYKYNI